MAPTLEASAVAALLCLAGAAMVMAGYAALQHARRVLKCGRSSTGVVTRIVTACEPSPEPVEYFSAVIEFQDASGHRIEIEEPAGTIAPPYREGQQVTVVYDAQDPHHAVIKSFMSLWYAPLALVGAGALLTAGGIAVLLLR